MSIVEKNMDTINNGNIVLFPSQEKFNYGKENPAEWVFVRSGAYNFNSKENTINGKFKILDYKLNKKN